MNKRLPCILAALSLAIGCDSTPSAPVDTCGTVALPLRGAAAGPVVTDVGLEVQQGVIVVVATATDPQGSENLRDVQQVIGVFPTTTCAEAPILIEDDLVGSGIEETFGTVVARSTQPALHAQIAAAQRWPVSVRFADSDGNETAGRVLARVIR